MDSSIWSCGRKGRYLKLLERLEVVVMLQFGACHEAKGRREQLIPDGEDIDASELVVARVSLISQV